MKQTAVEWLENEFQEMCKDFGGLNTGFIERFKQAKAMEKEQIMDAFKSGNHTEMRGGKFIDVISEQYYNETFKSE